MSVYAKSDWFKGCRVLFKECLEKGNQLDFFILSVILHRCRYNGNRQDLELGEAFIGLNELGKLVRASRKEVEFSLRRLEKKGITKVKRRENQGTTIMVLLPSFYSNLQNVGENQSKTKGKPRDTNIEENRINKPIEHIYPESGIKPEPQEHPSSPETSKSRFKESLATVINHLNQKVGRRYAASGNSQKLVEVLLKKGHTVEEFQKVIDSKVHEWVDDPKMKKHLSPPTLFRPSNFEKYLEAANAEIPIEEKYAELLGLT